LCNVYAKRQKPKTSYIMIILRWKKVKKKKTAFKNSAKKYKTVQKTCTKKMCGRIFSQEKKFISK